MTFMSLQLQQKLQTVLKRSDIWQGTRRVNKHAITTGYTQIDEILHYSGWPLNRISEILVERAHIGEMQLVLPAVAKITEKGGWLFLIEPPFMPYAPAWLSANIDLRKMVIIRSCQEKDWLWSAEQIMACPATSCTLFWPPKDHLSNRVLKRLQLAVEKGSQLNFIFRSLSVVNQSSSASLRVIVKKTTRLTESFNRKESQRALSIEVLKQVGGWGGQKVEGLQV